MQHIGGQYNTQQAAAAEQVTLLSEKIITKCQTRDRQVIGLEHAAGILNVWEWLLPQQGKTAASTNALPVLCAQKAGCWDARQCL